MQIKRYSDGSMKLHIDDEDNYSVTDDNGVDVWLTEKQVERITSPPTSHPQRCETCSFHTIPIDEVDRCKGEPITIGEFEAYQKRGCATHPPQQSGRDKEHTPIICLCGSTRFTHEMLIKQWELTKQGYIVVSWCALPDDYYQGDENAHIGDQEGVKSFVDEIHKRKIDISDEVLVIDINGYVGESTRSEINYAIKHRKPVRYLSADPARLHHLTLLPDSITDRNDRISDPYLEKGAKNMSWIGLKPSEIAILMTYSKTIAEKVETLQIIDSRLHTSQQSEPIGPGELEYGSILPDGTDWRLRKFDSGMGETEYRIFRDEKFFAQFANRKDADIVMVAMTIEQGKREKVLDIDMILSTLKKWYHKEMAILDYIEMIECEIVALRQQGNQESES